jgi:two-component system, LytTR family, sensor kinase
MNKTATRYWTCQLIGWGAWVALQVFAAYAYVDELYFTPDKKRDVFFVSLFIEFVWCILATHLLRMVLKRFPWIKLSIRRVVLVFVASVLTTALLINYGSKVTAKASGYSFEQYVINEKWERAVRLEKDSGLANTNYYSPSVLQAGDSAGYKKAEKIKKFTGWSRNAEGKWVYKEIQKGREFWNIVITLILVALWLLIYIVWHYIEKNRNDQFDKLKLESLVKELELKTIKSHINPHFIFNALNSIRALVDENPTRARTAITELSNILRSSMHAEKLETVPLHRELDIVNDYLALEQMRFEERLQVTYEIDEDTLDQPVPPMMLQTLVENAIKHGISRQINGGSITIKSLFVKDQHEICVINSGQLTGKPNGDGFGLKSTQDRLNLLYQDKASFHIRNINGNMVESKIIMPVTNHTASS